MSNSETDKKPDPLEQWRGMRDAYLEAWSKSMVQSVNTDAYAKATGAMLDAYLTASLPFREALEKAMVQALQQLSMPTRADFLSLAERLTNVEIRLDDLDIKVDRIEQATSKLASAESLESKFERMAQETAKLGSAAVDLQNQLERMEQYISKSASATTALEDKLGRVERTVSKFASAAADSAAVPEAAEPLAATPSPKPATKKGSR